MSTQWVTTTIEHLDFDSDIECESVVCSRALMPPHPAQWWWKPLCTCRPAVLAICEGERQRIINTFPVPMHMTCPTCGWMGMVSADIMIIGPIR